MRVYLASTYTDTTFISETKLSKYRISINTLFIYKIILDSLLFLLQAD